MRVLAVQGVIADHILGNPIAAQRLIDAIGFVGDRFQLCDDVSDLRRSGACIRNDPGPLVSEPLANNECAGPGNTT